MKFSRHQGREERPCSSQIYPLRVDRGERPRAHAGRLPDSTRHRASLGGAGTLLPTLVTSRWFRFTGLFVLIAVGNIRAQQPAPAPTISIVTKDGQTITTTGVRRAGTAVMAKIRLNDGGEGEAGYEAANIARMDFPEPGQLKIANGLLGQGRADEAIKELAPIVAYYAPFKDLPGSRWTPLALLELDAYSRLGRDAEADALAVELGRLGAVPPDVQRAITIRKGVSLERGGKHREALALLEPIARDENAPAQSLSEAWLAMGAANLALGRDEAALLAYLHVPVYVPDRALAMAPALLGSATAYLKLDDRTHAKDSLQQLISAYPNSREAAEAKDRLQKLNVGKAKAAPQG